MSTRPIAPEPAGRLGGYTWLILFAAAAVILWWGLDLAEHRAKWLRVEAPRRALAGQPYPVRVQLAALAEPGFLCADLHWGTTRDAPMQYLASAGRKAVGKDGGTFEFEVIIPAHAGMRFVMGVIYFGRTGSWGDRKLTANTEIIPVVNDPAAAKEMRLEPLRLQPPSEASSNHLPAADGPRLLTGLVLLVAMAGPWGGGPSDKAPDERRGKEARWRLVLAVLLGLACLWELFGLEHWLGERARAMARAGDLYNARAWFQKVVISAAAAATVLLLPFIRRARHSDRLVLVALALYLAISAVNLVSLHAIDNVADLSWHGVSLVQALKLGCGAMIVLGVRRMRRAG